MYVVFLNHAHNMAVAYDLGAFNSFQLDVLNYGYGTLQDYGDWSQNGQSGVFESQGGLATLQEIDDAMRQAAKTKPLVQFNWPLNK